MNQTPTIDEDAAWPIGAALARKDPGINQRIEDCMNESARQLAASEARLRGVQE